MIDPKLNNKVALVTGGNHGIGAAIAQAFASLGAKVFLTYYRVQPDKPVDESRADQPGEAMYALGRSRGADRVIKAIRDAGGTVEASEADLSDPAVIPALFEQVESTFGGVDILVNNAAHWEPATFTPQGEDMAQKFSTQWMSNPVQTFAPDIHDRAFAVNTRGIAHMMTEFARRHIKRGAESGSIINISTSGAYSFPAEVTYGASKLAMESYSRAAAVELGPFGIRVNILSPGPIQTGYITPDMETVIANDTPLRRVGYPDDIADVAVFLASEQARWVTGQLIHVGGGHTM